MFLEDGMLDPLFELNPILNVPIAHSEAKKVVNCAKNGKSSGFDKVPYKGALSWYGKLTWESAHAWNLIILCLLIVWGMTFIFMVHLSFYAIPLLIYDVMYDITTIP